MFAVGKIEYIRCKCFALNGFAVNKDFGDTFETGKSEAVTKFNFDFTEEQFNAAGVENMSLFFPAAVERKFVGSRSESKLFPRGVLSIFRLRLSRG